MSEQKETPREQTKTPEQENRIIFIKIKIGIARVVKGKRKNYLAAPEKRQLG